ncbi:uncharacterized protein PG998_014897 [Apiospora kogelbergensis]|uniref:uncharacterized protein n=1 Tax=Apiospora kogelbergensis TaxID=1337665 RepID=UPI00312D609F
MFPLFDRFFDANACATAAKIPNMSCTEITLPNSSRAAILLPTNATTIHQQKDNGPGKQLQLASYYPGDPGQPPITECAAGGYFNDDDGDDGDLAATGADCYAIRWWAQTNVGFWTLTPDNLRADPWTVFVTHGDCTVLASIPADQKTPNWPIYVGDQDLDNILDTVLTRFMDNDGKVQADGVINCPTSDGKGGLDMVETTFWIRSSKGIIT